VLVLAIGVFAAFTRRSHSARSLFTASAAARFTGGLRRGCCLFRAVELAVRWARARCRERCGSSAPPARGVAQVGQETSVDRGLELPGALPGLGQRGDIGFGPLPQVL
jgi:hypothetical protein